MLKVIELFAGYGSQSLALRNLGVEHEVVGISEIDKYAIQAYNLLHEKEVYNFGDIKKIDETELPHCDLLTYSFPCTSVSTAGKQAGLSENSGTTSSLLWECRRIIKYKKPKYLLMENVKNLVGKKFKPEFDKWLKELDEMGYNNYWSILNSKDYKVPQNRERVFCISILKEIDNGYKFPEKQELKLRLKDMLEDDVDEKYYLSNDRVVELIEKVKLEKMGVYPTEPNTITSALSSREHRAAGWKDICGTLCARDYKDPKVVCVEPKIIKVGQLDSSFEQSGRVHSTEGISPTVMGNSHGKTNGGYNATKILEEPKINVIGNYMPSNYDASRIVDNDGLAPTVKENHGTVTGVYHNYKIRKLTPKECFRLMGVYDSDIDKLKSISNSQQYKLAGNSIVIPVLEAIFKNLFQKESE